jgi:hypothetical protein
MLRAALILAFAGGVTVMSAQGPSGGDLRADVPDDLFPRSPNSLD